MKRILLASFFIFSQFSFAQNPDDLPLSIMRQFPRTFGNNDEADQKPEPTNIRNRVGEIGNAIREFMNISRKIDALFDHEVFTEEEILDLVYQLNTFLKSDGLKRITDEPYRILIGREIDRHIELISNSSSQALDNRGRFFVKLVSILSPNPTYDIERLLGSLMLRAYTTRNLKLMQKIAYHAFEVRKMDFEKFPIVFYVPELNDFMHLKDLWVEGYQVITRSNPQSSEITQPKNCGHATFLNSLDFYPEHK